MRPLAIGISCYPSVGGSGIVATGIGQALARRGHQVHFVCTEVPRRLDLDAPGVWFHPVPVRDYPVFPQIPYGLALTSALVDVARRHDLDLVHAHYAVPHATSAWMAREIMGDRLKVVTTLHGTDITFVGADPSFLPVTRHAIACSDAVTAPSTYLAGQAHRRFDLDPDRVPIEVIPNAVDVDRFCPASSADRPGLTDLFGPDLGDDPVLVHVSNFREVKRVDRVVEVFARVAARRPARLLLIGDGPERDTVARQIASEGLNRSCRLVGTLDHPEGLLRESTVFVLPSHTEGFGLAALEALSSGVPVVASAAGGLPEVVDHGRTGFLVEDAEPRSMAGHVLALIDDPAIHRAMAAAARADVLGRFRMDPVVDGYAEVYRTVIG